MSDWLKEVEHASCSVQYVGETETNPLISAERRHTRYVKVFWVVFLLSLLGVGACIGTYLILEELDGWPKYTPYMLVSRKSWSARESVQPLERLHHPASKLVVTQTLTDPCSTQSSCLKTVRELQDNHMDRKYLADIAYNFLIGGDGVIYEGRGWRTQPEMLDLEDKDSIVVALIGSFRHKAPLSLQLEELELFIEEALDRGALSRCHKFILYISNTKEVKQVFKDLLGQQALRNVSCNTNES